MRSSATEAETVFYFALPKLVFYLHSHNGPTLLQMVISAAGLSSAKLSTYSSLIYN